MLAEGRSAWRADAHTPLDEPRPELRRDAGISAAVGRVQERTSHRTPPNTGSRLAGGEVVVTDPAPCNHCHLRPAAPDRRQCERCLDIGRARYRRNQERKHSAEGLALELKDVRRAGRQYVKTDPATS